MKSVVKFMVLLAAVCKCVMRLCFCNSMYGFFESDDDVFDKLCGLMSGQSGYGDYEIIEKYRATKSNTDNGYYQYRSTMSKPQYMSKWVSDKKAQMEAAYLAEHEAYINALSVNKDKVIPYSSIISSCCDPLSTTSAVYYITWLSGDWLY